MIYKCLIIVTNKPCEASYLITHIGHQQLKQLTYILYFDTICLSYFRILLLRYKFEFSLKLKHSFKRVSHICTRNDVYMPLYVIRLIIIRMATTVNIVRVYEFIPCYDIPHLNFTIKH